MTHVSNGMPRVFLIGCGNPLRGDDGAGWRVVEAVAERWAGRVTIRLGQQLVPEWALDLAEADVAFIVDACSTTRARLTLVDMSGPGATPIDGHVFGPGQLLALAERVNGRLPLAYVVEVPAADYRFGEVLSPLAAAGVRRAIRILDRRIASLPCMKSR